MRSNLFSLSERFDDVARVVLVIPSIRGPGGVDIESDVFDESRSEILQRKETSARCLPRTWTEGLAENANPRSEESTRRARVYSTEPLAAFVSFIAGRRARRLRVPINPPLITRQHFCRSLIADRLGARVSRLTVRWTRVDRSGDATRTPAPRKFLSRVLSIAVRSVLSSRSRYRSSRLGCFPPG